jgi:3-phenylpropionate/trans-cinnamate dioxygenase ferredoxin subunit
VTSNRANDIVDVAGANDLGKGELKVVKAGERDVVLARVEHGHAAFDLKCTHDGAPLADGSLKGDAISCRCGSQFDVMTGRVRHGPADRALRTYSVEERNGRVCVSLDDRLKGG